MRNLSKTLYPLIALAACTTRVEPAVIPDPPRVMSFAASPDEVVAGADITLTWAVENATKVSIRELSTGDVEGVDDALTGTVTVAAPTESAFFVLVAENARGARAMALATVLVQGAASNLLFQAVPALVAPSEPSMLVWSAPGARSVRITDGSGALVDLNGQLNAGSVMVNPPGAETTYSLTADGRTISTTVSREQAILELTATPPAARPGETVTLAWKTTNATKVTLSSPGIGTITTVTDPGRIANGDATQIVPGFDSGLGLPFVLRVEGKGAPIERVVTVFLSTAPVVLTATAPGYVRTGTTFPLVWTTRGADQVNVLANGVVLHQGVAQGSVTLPAPASDTEYSVVAVQSVTGDQSPPTLLTVRPVGQPTFVSFTPDVATIAQGGEPVVLSWNVTNGRHVTITEEGRVVFDATGPTAGTGTATVYPNQSQTRYTLTADNQAGDSITAQTLTVAVTSLARLTFSRRAPIGANTQVTGSTVSGGGVVTGLPAVRVNPPDAQFVDISSTGTPVVFSSATSGYQVINVGGFAPTLFGQRVTGQQLHVSVNGWLSFSNTGTTSPTAPTSIGNTLQPWSLAVFLANLQIGSGNAQWQVDTVAGEQRLIVQWNRFEQETTGAGRVTFQAQIYASGRVVFAYPQIDAFPGVVNVGAVNGTETEVLAAPAPVAGQTIELFGDAPTPTTLRVRNDPLVGFVKKANGVVRVEGDPRITPNSIVLSEVNARPAVAQGEWVEIVNLSSEAIDLSGWELRTDAGTLTLLPENFVVPAGARAVAAEAAGANDGVNVAAVYDGRVSLPDGGGGSMRLGVDGIAVSHVPLALAGSASAVQADPPAPWLKFPVTTVTQLTCATDAGYGTNGQLGTPGSAHARCFPYVLTDAGVPFFSIAATGVPLVLGTSPAADESVFTLDPGGPVQVGYATVPLLYVSTNGFISPTFISAPSLTNKSTPSVTSPGPGTIAPFWETLTGSTEPGSGIYWQRRDVGTPNESVIVSWERWRVNTTTVTSLNFQARFWRNGDITFAYGDMTAAGTSTLAKGSSATAWLEEPSGRLAAVISINSATAPGIFPNTSFRFAFTP
ncbi:MAG: lamin tail domain-containing protein [Myxococcaceae bacterium]|nr:lamin tail domain-containing protein [Myxococcaceae bacterium]